MSRTTRTLLSLALALPMSLGASAALAQSAEPDPYPLGTAITLTEMAGVAVAPEASISATFDADGSLSGFGGCNSYSATWYSDGTTLSIGPILATRMACDPTIDALESQYLGLLQGAASWILDGLALTVTSSDGSTLIYGGDSGGPALVGEWQLLTFGGTPIPNGIIATAVFGADGTLTGSGGCNTFSGTYTVDGASLSVSQLLATRMFCEAAGEIEPAYLDMLQAATGWSVDGDTLTIDSTVPLVFSSGAAPAGTLTGQEWFLVSMGGQTVNPTLGISATFADDGSVSGSGGCNGYDASYTVDGDSIIISPVLATRMSCAPDANESEAAFFAGLEGATSFAVSGTDLVIATSDGGTLEFSTSPGPAPSAVATSAPTAAPTAGSSAVATTGDIVGSWQMTKYAGQALPGGLLDISIVFAADGTLSGNGGCNDYIGTWSLSGTTIAMRDFQPGTDGTCATTAQGMEQGYFSLFPFLDIAQVIDGNLTLASSFAPETGFTFEPAD